MATSLNVKKMLAVNHIFACSFLLLIQNCVARSLVSNVGECESACAATYSAKEQAASQGICLQGCRLMSISDFMALGTGDVKDVLKICLQSCHDAYQGNDERSACAFGCQAQAPSVDSHHKHLEKYYERQMELSSPMSGLHGYYSRMMSCLMDHIDHHAGVQWNVRGSGNIGQMMVVLSIDSKAEPVMDGLIVSAEQKTSSYVETNLASVDRAATPNLKSIQQVESAVLVDGMTSDDDADRKAMIESDVDWMFCIDRTGTSKKLILLVMIVLLTSVMFCVCTGNAAPAQPYWQETKKLSINGDLDYLRNIDQNELLVSTKPQEPRWSAPPVPTKIPIQCV